MGGVRYTVSFKRKVVEIAVKVGNKEATELGYTRSEIRIENM